MKIIQVITITLLTIASAWSQSEMGIFYNDVMANAFLPSTRVMAEKKFSKLFTEELQQPNSFQNSFEEYKWVSFKYPQDSSFRVITYQLEKEEEYVQFGFIQMADGILHTLTDVDSDLVDLEFAIQTKDEWYGALYYNLIERGEGEDKHYVLFGYDGYNKSKQIKIIDVLTFENGEPIFGKEVFNMLDNDVRPTLKTKSYIRYDITANANSNYNNVFEMIIYDNIIEILGQTGDEGVMRVSDGSYKGFKWKDNQWQYVDRLSTRVLTEEEIYNNQPKTDANKRDLFGKPVKKRN